MPPNQIYHHTEQDIGINMLVYFSTRIFANIGLTSFMSQLLAAVMNTFFAIGTYCKLSRVLGRNQ